MLFWIHNLFFMRLSIVISVFSFCIFLNTCLWNSNYIVAEAFCNAWCVKSSFSLSVESRAESATNLCRINDQFLIKFSKNSNHKFNEAWLTTRLSTMHRVESLTTWQCSHWFRLDILLRAFVGLVSVVGNIMTRQGRFDPGFVSTQKEERGKRRLFG